MSDHSQQYVLCIPRRSLNLGYAAVEILPAAALAREADEAFFYRRDLAEQDEEQLQLIPYVVLLNYADNKLRWFNYWRQLHASEQRLAGKRSIGLGGHVDPTDVPANGRIGDGWPPQADVIRVSVQTVYRESILKLLDAAALRELQEEIGYPYDLRQLLHWQLFYTGQDPVGRVHLGVLFTAMIPDPQVLQPGPELYDQTWVPVDELQQHLADMETWSQEIIRRYATGLPAVCH
jgi:predicted NUDIX family phosphoesterase